MSIIKTVTPILTEGKLKEFKNAISSYNMKAARLIVDEAKDNFNPQSEEYITLDGVENDIICEIEHTLDYESSIY